MTVYLVDEAFLDVAFSYAAQDMEARIVLLQDAVYHATKGEARGKMYVLEDDVTRRGLKSRIHPSFQAIGYSDLVQMMEEETVVNFL